MKYRYLSPILIYSCFTTTEVVADAVTEQSPFRPGPELHRTTDPSLRFLPSLMGCPGCDTQPSIYCGFCKDPIKSLCCTCSSYCWCTLLCPLHFLRPAPDKPPYEAYVGFGDPDSRLCCGPDCSMDRCLKLIQLQFQILQEPLGIERNDTRDGDYKGRNGDDNCCGKGCSATGCFQHLLDSIILLQNPIQNTLDNFNDNYPFRAHVASLRPVSCFSFRRRSASIQFRKSALRSSYRQLSCPAAVGWRVLKCYRGTQHSSRISRR